MVNIDELDFEAMADRMVVLQCDIHGWLRAGQVVTNGTSSRGRKYLKCRECHKARIKKSYESNREMYRKKNIKNKRRDVAELRDAYIKKLLCMHTGLKYAAVLACKH